MLRGLALLCMFVAHCAPSDGPMHVFALSEFATAPLFALLIGVGAELGDRGIRGLPTAFVRAGLRAAVLVVIGSWVGGWGAQIDVVLVYLAIPTLLAPVLARLPVPALLALGTTLWAAGPALQTWGRERSAAAATHGDELGQRLWDVLVAGEHYRLTGLLVFTCLGIVVWRSLSSATSNWPVAMVGLAGLGVAALLLAAKTSGRLTFAPYEGSHLEVLFDVLLVGGFAALWFSAFPARFTLPPLAVAGAMTLSVYVAQVAYLAWYVRSYAPGSADDSWANVAVLSVGALVLPMLWRSLVRREPWAKGPIEGPTAFVTGMFR